MSNQHLILGGARSGKSSYAENLVLQQVAKTGQQAIYIAIAEAGDAEMLRRIDLHKSQRNTHAWKLVEETLMLGRCLQAYNNDQIVLLDCLTLWVCRIMICVRRKWEFETNFLLI